MENEKQGLVKSAETRLPKFVEDAYESVEKMKQFANILLNSKLVPNHFYEQLPDKKPDFSKGKVPAVVAVLIQGYQLQLPPLTALQHIIPVNGLLSIKGDLAKSMIFNSGKLKPGSWVEEEIGSIENGDYVVTITATRADNGQTLSRSFSVAQAKRAGLWITEQQVNGQDGWKYKSSAWWKYPTRMCNYRALGFIARDMFPDVMAGIYTTEEAMDIPKDAVEIIETESGAKITIPDKEHSKGRSDKMTSRVTDKIPDNKFGEVKKNDIQEATVINDEQEKKMIIVNLPTKVEGEGGQAFIARYNKYIDSALLKYPEMHLIPMKQEAQTAFKEAMDAINTTGEDKDESAITPQRGSVSSMDGKEIIRHDEDGNITSREPTEDGKLTLEGMEKMDTADLLKIINEDMDMMEAMEMIEGKNTNKKLRCIIFAHQNDNLTQYVADNMPKEEPKAGEIPPNKEFDQQKAQDGTDTFLSNEPLKKGESDVKPGNKYGITIEGIGPNGNRDFASTKTLFNQLAGVTPSINAPRFLELATKLGWGEKYVDKEVFCRAATISEINLLLNSN